MKLYYSDTLAPHKCCAVAHYLKSPVELVYVDLHRGEHKTPAYLAMNPNGKVPVLSEAGGSLWEADAIMCRLAELAGSDLWPRDARQIEVIRWLSWNAQHFNREGGSLYFEYIIKARFGIGGPDPAAVAEAQKAFRKHAAVLNQHLKGRSWLVGNDLSVADFSVGVVLPYARRSQMPLDEFPELRRWHGQLEQLDGWLKPFPVEWHGARTA
jgi:glutathione S-transferase